RPRSLEDAEEQMLDADVLIAELLRDLLRFIQRPREVRAHADRALAGDLRVAGERLANGLPHVGGWHAHVLEDPRNDSLRVVEQGGQQMLRLVRRAVPVLGVAETFSVGFLRSRGEKLW